MRCCRCYAFGCKCEVVATREGASDASRLAIYQNLSSECPSLYCGRASCLRYASVLFMGSLRVSAYLLLFFFSLHLLVVFILCSRWRLFVDVPLISSCPADHVLLPDMTGSAAPIAFNVKNKYTHARARAHTHTHHHQ